MTTNHDDTEPAFTLQQHAAVDLLVTGRNVTETAEAVGVTRQTVSEWVNHNVGFRAALHQKRRELWEGLTDRLRSLLPKAVDVLERELDSDHAMAAAVHLLKAGGVYGGAGTELPPANEDPARESYVVVLPSPPPKNDEEWQARYGHLAHRHAQRLPDGSDVAGDPTGEP